MSDLIVERAGPVTFIRTRSAARNAMNPEGAAALCQALVAFDADPDASVGVLWGAGGAFCAGFDLKHAASAG
ncbi:enoyl-CoA hydratase-related protein, partial [Klebsiella aerogenes]|uniref:enoyl-CoA hydratase-related protein n=1 Tax=Klebsiella aerogenes TaxID=548 RepID=UPI001D11A586